MNGDEQLVEKIKNAQLALEEIKGKQFAGADNLHIVESSSGNLFDFSASLNQGEAAFMTLTFDAANQDYPFAAPSIFVYRDGTAPSNLVTVLGISEETFDGNMYEHISSGATPKRLQWAVQYLSSVLGVHSYYFKAYVRSTDSGVIS